MKILFILATTEWDGSTFSCLSLLEGLTMRGHFVTAIIPDKNEAFISRLTELGVIVNVVPVEFNQWPEGRRRSFEYIKKLGRTLKRRLGILFQVCHIVKREHPDIIHTNVGPIDVGYFAALLFNIPHVWHIREYCDKDFNIRIFPNKFIYHKKLKHSYSISITKDLQSYNKLAGSKKSHVVYNGVRHVASISYTEEKEHYFLVASRVSREKAQDRIIKVFAEFHKFHPEYRLVILGRCDTGYVNECTHLAETLEIKDFVIFEGFKADVDSYLKKARALLVASPYEGFGRMTAEAAFNGCIVLGYDSSGTKEILETTGGYLWRTDADFLEAMNDVASLSVKEYQERAMAAQEAARNMFSIESYVNMVLSIYNKALTTA